MNRQRSHELRSPLDLRNHGVFLSHDGRMRRYEKSETFCDDARTRSDPSADRVLALHHVRSPADVHYPVWEMHPEGDELLILMSGSLSVEFRHEQRVLLTIQTACIVPAEAWHRLIVHQPSMLVAVTVRNHTVHERAA
jgi:mannose-6-phosphate isomerase-like protein (cupin superfamily)